jgi:putative transposase
MAWTETTRREYRRDGLRYASSTTDREWAEIEPLLPAARRLGRPRRHHPRTIIEAILYILATGCQWRALPRDFPPRSTVQGYFYRWRDEINTRLVARARQRLGRAIAPLAGIIDSQSAPTSESGGPRGVDAGKRIKGRKRHIVTDTEGFLLALRVHEANIQDPHGAVPLLRSLRRAFPGLRHIFADRVYRGEQLLGAIADCGPWTIEIVQRPAGVKGFQLLPRRWVVERTFAWLGRSRRLAKDFEATISSATAWVLLANLRLLSRRLARA